MTMNQYIVYLVIRINVEIPTWSPPPRIFILSRFTAREVANISQDIRRLLIPFGIVLLAKQEWKFFL